MQVFAKLALFLLAIAFVLYLARVAFLRHSGEKSQTQKQVAHPQTVEGETSQKSGVKSCDRPSPFETKEQFLRVHAAFERYITEEKFSAQELEEMPDDKIDDLAAGSYNLAYLTADKPESDKVDLFKKFNEEQTSTKSYADLSPVDKAKVQIMVQKIDSVLSKAYDLGREDGAKAPCK